MKNMKRVNYIADEEDEKIDNEDEIHMQMKKMKIIDNEDEIPR